MSLVSYRCRIKAKPHLDWSPLLVSIPVSAPGKFVCVNKLRQIRVYVNLSLYVFDSVANLKLILTIFSKVKFLTAGA